MSERPAKCPPKCGHVIDGVAGMTSRCAACKQPIDGAFDELVHAGEWYHVKCWHSQPDASPTDEEYYNGGKLGGDAPTPERTEEMYEDELPADMPKADYDEWFAQSRVDGVRIGPKYPPNPTEDWAWWFDRTAAERLALIRKLREQPKVERDERPYPHYLEGQPRSRMLMALGASDVDEALAKIEQLKKGVVERDERTPIDERAVFSEWYKDNYLVIAGTSSWIERAWAVWQARAALVAKTVDTASPGITRDPGKRNG